MPRGLKLGLLAGWMVVTPLTLAGSAYFYVIITHPSLGFVLGAKESPYTLFSQQPPYLTGVGQDITPSDARGLLVEKFLRKYHSPMQGSGAFFVEMADKYRVDWRLVPAIAFQESNLGKVIPQGSFNAWGWAVFTGKNSGVYFDSWPHAIETVTRGIARDYYSRGLKSPKQIQTRYTPGSNGSWAEAVQFAMEDIED
jgi:hypothetical protein